MSTIFPLFRSSAHLTQTADRSKRVKDAKNEAQKEIEDYRKQKDDEFKEFEKKVVFRFSKTTRLCARSKYNS